MNKLRLYMKTPDAVDNAIDEYLNDQGLDSEFERDTMKDEIKNKLDVFFEWGESVTLEFDLDTGIMRVVPLLEG